MQNADPCDDPIPDADGRWLLRLAQDSIAHGVRFHRPLIPDLDTCPVATRPDGACFVTLHLLGRLRGCIGSLQATRPLAHDVAANAYAAAFGNHLRAPVPKPGRRGG